MLFFQLWSHAHLYDEKGEHAGAAPASTRYPPKAKKIAGGPPPEPSSSSIHSVTTPTAVSPTPSEDEEEEIPQISVWMAIVLLILVTVLIAFTAEYLVASIDGLVENSPISKEWVCDFDPTPVPNLTNCMLRLDSSSCQLWAMRQNT